LRFNVEIREPDQVLRRALESTILTDKPNLSWNDVAGLPEAKQALQEAVQLPQKFPQLFTGLYFDIGLSINY